MLQLLFYTFSSVEILRQTSWRWGLIWPRFFGIETVG